jgi:chemotaxis-related protein WspB
MSTRVILVALPDASGKERLLGLLAEQVTDTVNVAVDESLPSGVRVEDAPYLGELHLDNRELVQRISVQELLLPPVRELLFPEEGSEWTTAL